jgi:replicative DNA helicase
MDTIGFEESLIGTLIEYPETWGDIDVNIMPSDFMSTSCQLIWERVSSLAQSGHLSKLSITETMRSLGLLEQLGQDVGMITGTDYIDKVCGDASPSSTGFFADRVVDASIRRQLNTSISLTKLDLSDATKPVDDILDAQEGRLWEMRKTKSAKGEDIGTLLDILDATIDDYRSGKRLPAYVPKNQDIKNIVGYLEDQDFMIIGGRPGEGKSSLLRSEAFETSMDGHPVCIINMDNGEIDYSRYLVAHVTGINSRKIRNPRTMDEGEVARVKAAIQQLKRLPMRIITMGSPSVEQVLSAMKKAANDGSKIFFVDYIQQIQNPNLADDAVSNISRSSNALRGFNMKWKLPMIVASQFNREVVHRGIDAAPLLSDFKGSGSLEQDATIALAIKMLEWDAGILAQFPENLVQRAGRENGVLAPSHEIRTVGVKFYVLKNRNGPTGTSKDIAWDRSTNTYKALTMGDHH